MRVDAQELAQWVEYARRHDSEQLSVVCRMALDLQDARQTIEDGPCDCGEYKCEECRPRMQGDLDRGER